MIVVCVASLWLLIAAGTASALRQPWGSWTQRTPLLRQLGRSSVLRASADSSVEDGVSLAALTNTEQDSVFLQQAIRKWLDEEWIVQDVHARMAEKVAQVYLEGRRQGMDDLGEVMLEVGTTLESFEMADAFVSGWDVANKVSDLLMVRLDRELCACMGDMSSFVEESNTLNAQDKERAQVTQVQTVRPMLVPDQVGPAQVSVPLQIPTGSLFLQDKITLESAYRVRNAQRLLCSEFARYRLLVQFMDGEIGWDEMHVVVGLVLGFRLESTSDGDDGSSGGSVGSSEGFSSTVSASVLFSQQAKLSPWRWEVSLVPDVGDLDDVPLQQRMAADLPEDEGATDIVMESLAGIELYGRLKLSENAEVQRRILVTKWLYIQGFLNNQFPALEQYIPNHMSAEYEDFLAGEVY
ncbi:hypothetical protein B484DRAFT_452362 [Ochromonadaceae sp. CCMP2298]|nr:hypothetical protein B484DRAFT_452362 [Ochromonadaceae sp. CCMP2298]